MAEVKEHPIPTETMDAHQGQDHKEKDRGSSKSKTSRYEGKKWFTFFTKWFYLGIILILFSLVLSCIDVSQLPQYALEVYTVKSIVAGLLSSVGIALVVGCVFDFSKNSEAFLQLITSILSEIVVSKTFLETLTEEDKEQSLRMILKPSNSQLEKYSNINAFFDKRIREAKTMFNINFKTNVVLDVQIYRDKEHGRICAKTTMTQTTYKIQEKFEPIKLMLEVGKAEPLEVYAMPPLGKACKLEPKQESDTIGGTDYIVYKYDPPDSCQECDHLTIKRSWIECGSDHWINYCWQSLTPYEGLICSLKCESGLTIKEHILFDNRAYYHIKLSDDKSELEITSAQWLEADTGFVATISDTKIIPVPEKNDKKE